MLLAILILVSISFIVAVQTRREARRAHEDIHQLMLNDAHEAMESLFNQMDFPYKDIKPKTAVKRTTTLQKTRDAKGRYAKRAR